MCMGALLMCWGTNLKRMTIALDAAGSGRRFNHDVAAYLQTKPPDLPGACPFDSTGACPYGKPLGDFCKMHAGRQVL